MVTMKQQNFWFSGDINVDWRLDERTKTVGKQGIAAARATLAASAERASVPEYASAA